jgi:hypothetical protein
VNGYRINVPILAGVAVSIGVYLLFILTVSLKGYREVEEAYYRSEEEKNGSHS